MQTFDPKRNEQESGKGGQIQHTENPDPENKNILSGQEEEEVNYEEVTDKDSDDQDGQDDLDEQDDEEEGDGDKKENIDEKLEKLDPFNEHSPMREDEELGN